MASKFKRSGQSSASKHKKMRKHSDAAAAFGAVLQELRALKGLSQGAVASAVGVTERYIADVERGAREPTLVMLFKIARALDVDPSALIARLERKIQN